MNDTQNSRPKTENIDQAPPENNGNGRARRRIGIAVGVLAVLAFFAFVYWFFFVRGTVFTDDARLAGHLVDLAPQIAGALISVAVREGDPVRRDQEIFRLDSRARQAALDQAQAAVISAKANAASMQAKYDKAVSGNRPEEIRAAEADFKRLQNEEAQARREVERQRGLRSSGAAAQDDLDRAQTAYESARQNRVTAEEDLAVMRLGSRKEDVEAARADAELAKSRVAEAAAALEIARRNLEYCTVASPFDGWVVRRWVDPGTTVQTAQPVVSVFDPSTLRVDANIEEKHLGRIREGDEATIRVDAFPRLRLKGRVTKILRATNSEFSLIPSEGVSGTFIKVTQRVPLRISVTVPDALPLGPGLSVEARIRVGSAGSGAKETTSILHANEKTSRKNAKEPRRKENPEN